MCSGQGPTSLPTTSGRGSSARELTGIRRHFSELFKGQLHHSLKIIANFRQNVKSGDIFSHK